MSEVVLTLPENLVREAEANGLLKPEFIASLVAGGNPSPPD